MMNQYKIYSQDVPPSSVEETAMVDFLFQHLDQYGDEKKDIQKAVDYALQRNNKPGGLLFTAKDGDTITGVVVVNLTGMDGFIPENILVYIATHNEYRGQGIGKHLMQSVIEHTNGNIALHVEPDNPAKKLYEKLGFTNKYLEMRLIK